MALRILAAFAACLAIVGCDFVSAARDEAGAEAPSAGVTTASAARPEGWESLDGEGSTLRLYYQFVDERRQVRFVERLEDVPEAWRANVGFVKMSSPPPLSPGDAARARAKQVGSGGAMRVANQPDDDPVIVLYSATWCGACRKAKRYLDDKGVEYEVRDVDDPRHAQELLRRTGQRAIPVLDVDGRVLTGFNAQRYDALIDRA
jgi:glutaredoxin